MLKGVMLQMWDGCAMSRRVENQVLPCIEYHQREAHCVPEAPSRMVALETKYKLHLRIEVTVTECLFLSPSNGRSHGRVIPIGSLQVTDITRDY